MPVVESALRVTRIVARCSLSSPLIDLGVAESYPTLGPILEAEGALAEAAAAVASAIASGTVAQYSDFAGSPALRQAVAEVMSQNVLRGGDEPATADEIVITAGATAALEAIAIAICDQGDALIVPAPFYPAFYIDVGMRANVQIVPAQPAGQGITRDVLEAAAEKAHAVGHRVAGVLFTSPCNPRGTLHSQAETAAVQSFVTERKLQLIWDAVYAGTAFDEPTAVVAAPVQQPSLFGAEENIHTIWGLAKDCGLSGWRVGAIHSRSAKVIQALQPQMRFSGASRLAQVASLGLLGDTERTRRCLRQGAVALAGRAAAGRAALVQAGIPAAALSCSAPAAGPLDLIDFSAVAASLSGGSPSSTVDEALLWRTALELGVHVVRGSACGCPPGAAAARIHVR